MTRILLLMLTIAAVALALPHPQNDGVDDDVFGGDTDDTEKDVFGDDDNICENVEDDVFDTEDDYEDTFGSDYQDDYDYDTRRGDETATSQKEECMPKDTNQFLIDLRSNFGTSNDCNKTAKCTDYLGEGFSCVPYWQCKDTDSNVISDGDGEISLIDLREDEDTCVVKGGTLDASDEKCPDAENQVCCKNSNPDAKICPHKNPKICRKDFNKKEVITMKPTTPPLVTNSPLVTKPLRQPKKLKFDYCGRRSSKLKVENLKDPNSAQPGEFTHMCIIYKTVGGSRVYVGGASLIDKNKVITVAHKFYLNFGPSKTIDERDNIENLLVRCGEYNVKTEAELTDYQETTVTAMHLHPLYDPGNKYLPNNLVILETKQNFIYEDHIGPVCLPKPEDDIENAVCWSSGWGKDQFGQHGYYSDVLKKVKMPIVPPKKCEADMREALKKKAKSTTTDFSLDASHLCIGGKKDQDTCTGDGGSPHSCKIKGKWTQIGTVAWGISCGTEVPAIYSSIPDAMCWINHLMDCVKTADTNINGEDDDDGDLIDLRVVGEWDCTKYSQIIRKCKEGGEFLYTNYYF